MQTNNKEITIKLDQLATALPPRHAKEFSKIQHEHLHFEKKNKEPLGEI